MLILQLVYYRMMARHTSVLPAFLALAEILEHTEYVRRDELPALDVPTSIETSVNRAEYDFTNPGTE